MIEVDSDLNDVRNYYQPSSSFKPRKGWNNSTKAAEAKRTSFAFGGSFKRLEKLPDRAADE